MIELKEMEGMLEIYSPYNEDFIKKIKGLKGTFNKIKKCWTISMENKKIALNFLKEIYGYDMQEKKIIVEYSANDFRKNSTITIKNLEIAKRFTRNSYPALIDKDTIVISGVFSERGGSTKYPEIGKSDVILRTSIYQGLYDSLDDETKANLKIIKSESESEIIESEKIKTIFSLIEDLSKEELEILKKRL